MKKVLFATTALVLTAGIAAAEVKVSGDGRMGVVYDGQNAQFNSRIRAIFTPEQMLPAAGQGALGIEVRAERTDLIAALAPLAHQPTWLTVTAERAVSRAMGGSCSMPLAAHGQWLADGTLQLRAAWGDLETGAALVRAEDTARVHTLGEADALGLAVAARLRAHGARAANA